MGRGLVVSPRPSPKRERAGHHGKDDGDKEEVGRRGQGLGEGGGGSEGMGREESGEGRPRMVAEKDRDRRSQTETERGGGGWWSEELDGGVRTRIRIRRTGAGKWIRPGPRLTCFGSVWYGCLFYSNLFRFPYNTEILRFFEKYLDIQNFFIR